MVLTCEKKKVLSERLSKIEDDIKGVKEELSEEPEEMEAEEKPEAVETAEGE